MRQIPRHERIPPIEKLCFALGGNMDFAATTLLTSFLWMPFFNIGLGMDPVALGIVLMIFRAWDAITDPIMGHISDNARTRWGRRRPFMFVGAVSCAVLFPVFWFAPVYFGDTGRLVFLTVFGMLFFACFTCWSMPYYGLQLELTPNYDERTRLTAWMTVFNKASALAGGWVMALVTSRYFHDAEGKPDLVKGVQVCSFLVAACILCAGLLPALFVKERVVAAPAFDAPKESLWRSLRESFACRPLWSLILVSFLLVLGQTSVSALGQYMNIYYVFGGDIAPASVLAGWKQTISIVLGVGLVPVWTWLGERWDKRAMVTLLLTIGIAGHLSNFFLMRPDMPYLQLVSGAFESAALSAMWLFLPSMKADVADYDEIDTRRRREGSLNAFYSWFIKAALTLSMGIGGLVLNLSGFDAKVGAQPPEVLARMMNIYLVLPVAIWAVAMLINRYYPLNRARMEEIRAELEKRRGTLGG